MAAQLWELLIKMSSVESEDTLTCTECFAIMELLVEGAGLGIDLEHLEQLARNHLANCADCQEQIREQLSKLEAMIH